MRAKIITSEKVKGHLCSISIFRAKLLLTALLIAFASACPIHQGHAREKQAAMVIDANTGRVLYSKSGNELRYPASLTKIMTLYMVFELLDKGRLKPTTRIRISSQAASQPPSKLGLKVGKTIRLRDAMKALVTKSANDIAVAIAEHIAGSEAKFARLMTAKAKSIGMTKTQFRNASGLPDDRQMTTARDMLTLAIRIQEHFPHHYPIFKTKRFRYNGKTYKNHNTLLGRIRGVDGIKTGYIRKAGFNLVTSVKTGGKYVVAAVFGGKTAGARNREMRGLIQNLLPIASTRRTRPILVARPRKIERPTKVVTPIRRPIQHPRAQVVATPIEIGRPKSNKAIPSLRQSVAVAKVRPIDINDIAKPTNVPKKELTSPADWRPTNQPTYTVAGLNPFGNAESTQRFKPTQDPAAPSTSQKGTTTQPTAPAKPPGTLHDQLARLLSQRTENTNSRSQINEDPQLPTQQRPQPTSAATPQHRPAPTTQNNGPYQIQIGAYASHRDAQHRLNEVTRASNGLLHGYLPLTQEVARGNRKFYRARFAGFDRAAAAQTCRELRRRHVDCLVAREP